MFCFQCQETIRNQGCSFRKGFCGKEAATSDLQDLLRYTLKGIAILAEKEGKEAESRKETGRFIAESMFATITNANFDDERFRQLIREALRIRDSIRERIDAEEELHDAATWNLPEEKWEEKAEQVGVLTTGDEDVRSLRELLIYGLKGISAYAEHAAVLGYEDEKIYDFLIEGLASTTRELGEEQMLDLVMRAGETAVSTMALLDRANTETYGDPEITEVNIGVRDNPGILISGHDLRDMEELLSQTEGTGVDVYTHSEMLPANYYPAFKKYEHFAGNYGNSWWKQNEEFEKFNGPILMTTNCIIPVKDSYRDRIFTTGMAGWPGARHIGPRESGGQKDFSPVIEMAKNCEPPEELEQGVIIGGFAHNQVMKLADSIVEAVKSGRIKRFIVMAGCDGRHDTRSYFTEVAGALPEDTVILTAGCAKYRYNKLNLGEIYGIPRVLDAGQCNDSYSLAVIALKLKEIFELEDINELPISYDIAWYEQKAVAVLLALLSLGVKGIRLGPTLPAFLSPKVAEILVEKFDIRPTGEAEEDVETMISGN